MYVWNTPDLSDLCRTPSLQATLWSICQQSGVTTLLCDFSDAFVYVDHSLIASFIQAAHSNGIKIYDIPSVFSTDLATPTNSQTQIVTLLEYNYSYPSAKFDGISFDVESVGEGTAAINPYLSYIQTIKTFTNSEGQTLVSQGLTFHAVLDAPYYWAGTPYGNAAGVAAATAVYQQFNEIFINAYETTVADYITILADGPSVCETNGITWFVGYETSSDTSIYGEIGSYGLAYYQQLSAAMDAQFASYAHYGGHVIEDYETFSIWWTGFVHGTSHTASFEITIVPGNESCQVQLWLAVSATAPFSSEAAKSGLVSFISGTNVPVSVPITMPAAGIYYVYIDLYMLGIKIESFTEANPITVI
jgi:hypothetical protein